MRTLPVAHTATCDRISRVWNRLEQHYGRPRLEPNGEPVAELVSTILSQHTTDASSGKAFATLRAHFPTWRSVSNASVDELASLIRPAGLPLQKARTIKAALQNLAGHDLRLLGDLPVPEARARLTAIRGIGDKTASCVLLFALGMPAQPVDTHIERVCKRIGISADTASPTSIQHVLEACLPPDSETMYAFHVDMVRHGREICQARVPKCAMCVVSDLCEYFASMARADQPMQAAQS